MDSDGNQYLGCCVIVEHPESKKILLGKRKGGYKPGYYGFPGGRLEVGEPLIECAKRELLEETGVEAKKLEYLGAVRDCQGSYDFTHFIFLCRDFSGLPTLIEPEKCEGWEWLDVKKLSGEVLKGHRGGLELYRNHLVGNNTFIVDYFEV
jgi:8-oxo-dGTP pyrophosphatase MutT (NUDIX family)